MERSIISVTGRDSVGIIARICTVLDECGVNILDISQTIRQGIFNMMMIVESGSSPISYDEFNTRLQEVAGQLGVRILCQKEEIFDKIHRV